MRSCVCAACISLLLIVGCHPDTRATSVNGDKIEPETDTLYPTTSVKKMHTWSRHVASAVGGSRSLSGDVTCQHVCRILHMPQDPRPAPPATSSRSSPAMPSTRGTSHHGKDIVALVADCACDSGAADSCNCGSNKNFQSNDKQKSWLSTTGIVIVLWAARQTEAMKLLKFTPRGS